MLTQMLVPKSRNFLTAVNFAEYYSELTIPVQLLSSLRKVECSGLFLSSQNFIWFLHKNPSIGFPFRKGNRMATK